MLFYTKTLSKTLANLESTDSGLTNSEAAQRLDTYGPNSIKIVGEPLWKKLIEPFSSVFILILFIAAAISFFKQNIVEAVIITTIIVISALIYYVQRFSTERILRTLSKHQAQSVLTFRDKKPTMIDASDLVPGDVILLGEGEKVPADARLMTAESLRVNESQLTGESAAIIKQITTLTENKEIYEQTNMVFQGSFIVAGEAKAVVVLTGNDTEFGKIAALTRHANDKSPVQKKIDHLVTRIIGVVVGVAFFAFMLSMYRGIEISESIRFVIALSVSAVPESLPIAISVVLVLGMRRMAAKKALVRTMRSIETTGAITTIATDKTGTLTHNKLSIQTMWQPLNAAYDMKKILHKTINYRAGELYDPLDAAFYSEVTSTVKNNKNHPIHTLSFDQAAAMSGNIWHHGEKFELYVKGAPEHVLDRCDMTISEKEHAETELHRMTSAGHRVVAIASVTLQKEITSFSEIKKHDRFDFIGFVAVADTLRKEAKSSIQAAVRAGITVRMITGDHFETAYHIGRELGMVTSRKQVFDSRKLHVMSDDALLEVIDDIRVFSRVIPEHKYRILSLLKQKNITAMTGDGVNDVPALTNAHVGVSMGSGASIAKDASDIILLDDNFKGIVEAIREGRIILANIRRMLFYLLSTNAGEVMTMLGALIINLPLPLLPVQILWINLVTDTSLVIPLGLEPGEKSNMKRPPQASNAPILSKLMISRMLILALTMAALTLSLFAFYTQKYGVDYGRTIAFSALVVIQWASALSARSSYESTFTHLKVFNGKFYIGLSLAILLQLLALFGPLAPLLGVSPVAIGDLFITGLVSFFTIIVVMEVHKYISRKYFNRAV